MQILDQDGNYLRMAAGGNPQQPFGIEIDPTELVRDLQLRQPEVLKYTVDGPLLASWWRPAAHRGVPLAA